MMSCLQVVSTARHSEDTNRLHKPTPGCPVIMKLPWEPLPSPFARISLENISYSSRIKIREGTRGIPNEDASKYCIVMGKNSSSSSSSESSLVVASTLDRAAEGLDRNLGCGGFGSGNGDGEDSEEARAMALRKTSLMDKTSAQA